MNFFWPGDMKNFRIKMVLMPVRDKDKKRLVFICCRNFSLVIIKETAAMGKFCQKTAVTNISYSTFPADIRKQRLYKLGL